MKIARKLLFWIPLGFYITYTIFVWYMFIDSYLFLRNNPDQSLAGLGLAVVLIYFVLILYSVLCVITLSTSIVGFVFTKKLKKRDISCSNSLFILTLVLPIVTEIMTIVTFVILM